jgi:hypothetical protein
MISSLSHCFCSKRIGPDFHLGSNEFDDESEQLVQSLLEGEVSKNDLEKVQHLSILWNACVMIAKKLSLGDIFLSSDQDYSSLQVHVSRFLGAFLSTFELILEQNSSLLPDLTQTAFEIFTNNDNSKQDAIVQLLKEYKDWFPFSYMFNRRTGKYPRSSFDHINQYFSRQQNQRSGEKLSMSQSQSQSKSYDEDDEDHGVAIGEEAELFKYEDEYVDTFTDSFAAGQFPDFAPPNIMPLKPFDSNSSPGVEGEARSKNKFDHREYQYAVQRSPSTEENQKNKLPMNEEDHQVSASEEYILKSYYDYSGNWNNNPTEEDEDSDRDTSYISSPPVAKRMTRMKTAKKEAPTNSRFSNKKNHRRGDSDDRDRSPVIESSENNRHRSTFVSFVNDERNKVGSHEDDEEVDVVQVFEVEDFSPDRSKIIGNNSRGASKEDRSVHKKEDHSVHDRKVADRSLSSSHINTSFSGSAPRYKLLEESDSGKESNSRNESSSRNEWKVFSRKDTGSDSPENPRQHHQIPPSATSHPRLRFVLSESEEGFAGTGHHGKEKSGFSVGDISPPRRANELSGGPLRRHTSVEQDRNRLIESSDSYSGFLDDDEKETSYGNALGAAVEQRQKSSFASNSSRQFQELFNEDYEKAQRLRESTGSLISIPAARISVSFPKADNSPLRSGRSSSMSPSRSTEEKRFSPPSSRDSSVQLNESFSLEKEDKLKRIKQSVLKQRAISKEKNPVETVNTVHIVAAESTATLDRNRVNVVPVNRDLLPFGVIKKKTKSLSKVRSLPNEGKQEHSLVLSDSPLLPVTTPLLKRISSFDMRQSRAKPQELPTNRFSVLLDSTNEDLLLEKLHSYNKDRNRQSSFTMQQSVAMVNLSQSVNNSQSLYQSPFQEIPVSLTLPPLSEFAEKTGVIFEGFLLKKSSSLLGQWQRRYFVLKESPINFCELNIHYDARDSLWGTIPLRLKCTITIFDIASIETSGKMAAQGKISSLLVFLVILLLFFLNRKRIFIKVCFYNSD